VGIHVRNGDGSKGSSGSIQPRKLRAWTTNAVIREHSILGDGKGRITRIVDHQPSNRLGDLYRFAGELHYVSGPTGPKDKNLGRSHICQGRDEDGCVIREDLAAESLPRVISEEEWERLRRRRENKI